MGPIACRVKVVVVHAQMLSWLMANIVVLVSLGPRNQTVSVSVGLKEAIR